MCKVNEDLKEIYEYQTDSDYVNDCLTNIRNNLTELEDRSRSNNIKINGTAEEVGETLEKYERKTWCLLSEGLEINDVVMEHKRAKN